VRAQTIDTVLREHRMLYARGHLIDHPFEPWAFIPQYLFSSRVFRVRD
jgi:hypothetical protein